MVRLSGVLAVFWLQITFLELFTVLSFPVLHQVHSSGKNPMFFVFLETRFPVYIKDFFLVHVRGNAAQEEGRILALQCGGNDEGP